MADQPAFTLSNQASSPAAYQGPWFQYNVLRQPTGLTSWGYFLRELKRACTDYYTSNPSKIPPRVPLRTATLNCIYNNLDPQQQLQIGVHAYITTLWPAFISLIVATGPDPSHAAYDNLGWALVLALTSGGAFGFESAFSHPHVLDTTNASDARRICETRSPTAIEGRKVPRYSSKRPKRPGGWSCVSIGLLCLSFALWAALVISWLFLLYKSIIISQAQLPFSYAAIWYFIGPAFSVVHALVRAIFDLVDLYEPMTKSTSLVSLLPNAPGVLSRDPTMPWDDVPKGNFRVNSDGEHKYFRLTRRSNAFAIWWRIAKLQLSGKPYRLVVHPWPSNYFLALLGVMDGVLRFVLLIYGSIVAGSTTVYPFPDDYIVMVFLVLATAGPRFLWSRIQEIDSRGADLIVYVRPVVSWS